jgi:uncharacterized membrane protein YedE/YeeE
MNIITALVSGLIFGVGLVISGMTEPAKVIGFLDVAGDWDPTLAFVMGGAIAMHAPLKWFFTRREAPLFDDRFHLPTATILDKKLITGAALFGIGWGLAGFCPGPALTSMATSTNALTLAGAMVIGMLVHGCLPDRWTTKP